MSAAVVRRPRGEDAQRLHAYLVAAGFTAAILELDEADSGGRQAPYREGDQFTVEQVAAFGSLLRGFHDASRGFDGVGEGTVICHREPSPRHTLFVAGTPTTLTGLHMAEPGVRLEDVGNACWHWCIAPGAESPEPQAQLMVALVDAYGIEPVARRALAQQMLSEQSRAMSALAIDLGRDDPSREQQVAVRGDLERAIAALDYTRANLDYFKTALA